MNTKYKLGILISILFIGMYTYINRNTIHASEPIMEYKYTVEEQKIKSAQFIWMSCIEELRIDKTLTNKEATNINKYLRSNMQSNILEAPMKKYTRQKKILKVDTVDNLVEEEIISKEQGEKLLQKLNRYDLSNLER